MITRRWKQLGAAALLLGSSSAAMAVDLDVGGFGQLVAGQQLDEGGVPPARGYDDRLRLAPESLVGGQLTAGFRPGLDAVVQVVARGSEDFEPQVTWAYVRGALNDHWSLRVGRLGVPSYRYSDARDVSVSYPLIRPPLSVYDLNYRSYEGASLVADYKLGHWALQPQLFYGSTDTRIKWPFGTGHVKFNHSKGVVLTADYAHRLSLRAAYLRTEDGTFRLDDPGYQALLQGLRATGNAAAADRIEPRGDAGYFASLGAELRHGNFIFGSELARYEMDDSFVDSFGWYTTAGYRWKRWTPLVTVGRRIGNPGNAASRMTSPDMRPFVEGFEAATDVDVRERGLGLRYDLRENLALKLDYTRLDWRRGAYEGSELVSAAVVFNY